MLVVGLVLAVLAALLHVYIFWLESFAWTTSARRVFGTSVEEAAATRELAYNQGFYNLFLALVALVGVVVVAAGERAVGTALVLAGVGPMLAAALVLGLSGPGRRAAALAQGSLPGLAVVAIVVALIV
ncbi:DUF1304 domain-containing protein [Sanguibacter sp. HDW7]|uniref:DUF1304 domain-containing protein n=1 Tax=Sanguibacter sp. HDW7 TaxID=2714931 RepID=UPI0014081593|nr:DUF1304 domain-containing protein [Sanguibacter sp. HDW7]QIK83036.1 DUF1304 domain-containing protein [Sanguibacter sp. HDW7]